MFATQNGIITSKRSEPIFKEQIQKSIDEAHPSVKPLLTRFETRDGKLACLEWWPALKSWTIVGED